MKQNSFGYGGANAHAILDAVQSYLGDRYQTIPASLNLDTQPPKHCYVLPFSAHNEKTLDQNIQALSQSLSNDTQLPSLAYTLGSCRSNHTERAFIMIYIESDGAELSSKFTPDRLTRGIAIGARPELAFIFTGQGAQWARMGHELVERYEVVRKTLRELGDVIASLYNAPQWNLLEALAQTHEKTQVNEAELSQTLTTAIQIAMVDLLRSWSVIPTAVAGHSSGKIRSACSVYRTDQENRRNCRRVLCWLHHSQRSNRHCLPTRRSHSQEQAARGNASSWFGRY